MRNIKGALLLIVVCFSTTGNAQLWKKLTKRAEQAAKEKIAQKVEEKAAKETEKTFDTLFNNKGRVFKKKKAKKLAKYAFTHEYVMEVIREKDTTDITYYLTNENEYMGSSFTMGKDQEFITVLDLPNSAIHTFMDFGNRKTSSSIKIDLEEPLDTEMDQRDFSISPTGQFKEVVGFLCEEFQVTGPQVSGTVWVTQEADISFQKAFARLKTKKMKISKGIDQSWLSGIDGLALEVKMIDYSQKNPKPIQMICTSLKERNFSIDTIDYEKTF